MTKLKYRLNAAIVAGLMVGTSGQAHAQAGGGPVGSGSNISSISDNIGGSIQSLPGLISGIAYLLGTLLAVLGVMKLKDHVENPGQTPLKDGAVRIAIGGSLLMLPMLLDVMSNTVGQGTGVTQAPIQGVRFSVN